MKVLKFKFSVTVETATAISDVESFNSEYSLEILKDLDNHPEEKNMFLSVLQTSLPAEYKACDMSVLQAEIIEI